MVALTDLPTDILYNIIPYLDAAEFLAFISTTRVLQTYRQDPNFWRSLTRTTFRIPPQPLLQADGARWQWLYRRLRTQTRLYTWGSNGCGNLGHGFAPRTHDGDVGNFDTNARNIGWPKNVAVEDMPEDIGIIADVQCGGWSTTLLNSSGCLFICGGVNEMSAFMTRSVRRELHRSRVALARQLTFPSAYPSTTRHSHEPSTAIAQFSSGRKHILGLADDGKVWQWNQEEARLIKPLHVDVSEKKVTRVVAGWDRASIYVNGAGIIYWPDHIAFRSEHPTEEDALLIDTATIPGTSFLSSTGRDDSATPESRTGQVTNHIVLENYIVFITKLNKVFLYRTDFPLPELDPPDPVELTTFYSSTRDVPFEVRDLQGSFRSFAVFTTSGDVLMGNRAMLDTFYSTSQEPDSSNAPLPKPPTIPALENNSITSIAFGDHHFQALRSDGTILAYGTDNQSCGALGLGFPEGTGPLRGLLANGFSNGSLGDNVGRQVWFDPTMHRWLAEMKEKAHMEGEVKARADMVLVGRDRPGQNATAVMALGDYFEREGRKWEHGVKEDGEMGSYFVLKVAAAGWHSAALALVDEEKAERARMMHVVPPEVEDEANEKEGAESEEDWHGGTWEDIDAPWDQLSKAVLGVVNWVWGLGRWFLGLQARDERAEAEKKRKAEEDEQKEGEERDVVKYTWSNQPFPRLRMGNGENMPGEIEITE